MNSLSWFDRLFPIAMILLPLLTSLGQPSDYANGQQRLRHRRVRRWLILGTATCVVIVMVLWRLAPDISRFSWTLVFLLSPISMHLINLRNPEVARAWLRERRTANLAAREVKLAAGLRLLSGAGWLVWLVLLGLTLAGLMRQHWQMAWLIMFHAFAAFWLLWSRLFSARTVQEGEPLPQQPTPQILQMYQRFRTGRQLLWIVIGLGAMLAFALPPTILSWYPEEGLRAAIWIGAGGGALGGVAGGLAGGWADRQRVALARMVLQQEQAAD